MRKQILRLIALLVFASATVTGISGCTVEYRQRHHHVDNNHDRGDHDHDHNYRGY